MATVTAFTAERMQEIENNMVHVNTLHTSPSSMAVFGDSYVDPSPPGSSGPDGIPKRVKSALKVPAGSYQNLAVSGGMARNHRKESCYRTVWDFFNLKRAEAPYTPDSAYVLLKFDTNDAVYGTSASQKKGFVGATRSMIARAQAGSVYQYNDPSVATSGGRLLYWASLGSEPYRVDQHDPDFPWGSGSGCLMLETVGETITITVPEDHTGYVDLFFIGAYYGGSATIHVNGVLHGTMVSGGCGITWYGKYLTDERNGLVYRIGGIAAGAATIVITCTDLDAGVTGSTGFIAFDSWSIRAANENLPFVQIPEMALPDGGLSAYWSGVGIEEADTYTDWKHELVDELNTGLPTDITAVGVPATRDALLGFNVIVDGEDVDAAGHPPRDACVEFAKHIVRNYSDLVQSNRQVSWATSWEIDEEGGLTPSVLVGNKPPVVIYDDFEVAGALASPWVLTAGTWTKADGVLTAGAGIVTKAVAYQDAGTLDGKITAIQSGAAADNNGVAFRVAGSTTFVELVQSSTYLNWFYRCILDGVTVASGVVVGPHVDETKVEVVVVGELAYIFFDGVESASSPINISTNMEGTGVGIVAPSTTKSSWARFSGGPHNDAVAGQLYIDTELGHIWGPYNADTESFPGPYDLLTASTILTRLLTVDGADSALDADKVDGYEATDLMGTSKLFYAGELAASRPTTAIATQASVGTRTSHWTLLDGADHGVNFGFIVPAGWNSIHVDVKWTPSNTDVGNVRFVASRVVGDDGGLTTTWGVANVETLAVPNGTASTVQTTRVLSGISVTPGKEMFFCVERDGDDAADAFTGTVNLLSVKIIRAS